MTPVVDPLIDWSLAVAIFTTLGFLLGRAVGSYRSLRSEERGEARRLERQLRRHPSETQQSTHVRVLP